MSERPRAYLDPPPRPAFALPVPPDGKPLTSLALNESAFGCSPRAIAAAEARQQTLNRYPDPASNALRAAIAAMNGLDKERIVCGNGSEELLDVIARLFARPGDEIVMSQSGFFQFALAATRTGAALVRAPERDFVTDIDALLALVTAKTRIVFLALPNNPTGVMVPVGEVQRLHARLPGHAVLVLDLAYGEYLPPDDLARLMALAGQNLVITRSFSKAYGLAALRVGWLYAPDWMIPGLNLVRGIGSVNAIAQAAAAAAIADPGFVRQAVARTAEQRALLAAGLARLRLHHLDGFGNFLLTQFPEAGNAADFAAFAMREEGMWLRSPGEPGFADWLRIGVGTESDTRLLLATLERFMVTGQGPLK